MSDYDNYQEAAGWEGPQALPLGMYGRRLQFIIFDKEGNQETVITGVLIGVTSEFSRVRSTSSEVWNSYHRHSAEIHVPALVPNGDMDNTLSLPLGGRILWKEIP